MLAAPYEFVLTVVVFPLRVIFISLFFATLPSAFKRVAVYFEATFATSTTSFALIVGEITVILVDILYPVYGSKDVKKYFPFDNLKFTLATPLESVFTLFLTPFM